MVLAAAVAGLGTVHSHQGAAAAAAAAAGTDPAREGLARFDAGANGPAKAFDSVSLSGGSNWDVTGHWFDASRILSIDFSSGSHFDARTVGNQPFTWPVGLELTLPSIASTSDPLVAESFTESPTDPSAAPEAANAQTAGDESWFGKSILPTLYVIDTNLTAPPPRIPGVEPDAPALAPFASDISVLGSLIPLRLNIDELAIIEEAPANEVPAGISSAFAVRLSSASVGLAQLYLAEPAPAQAIASGFSTSDFRASGPRTTVARTHLDRLPAAQVASAFKDGPPQDGFPVATVESASASPAAFLDHIMRRDADAGTLAIAAATPLGASGATMSNQVFASDGGAFAVTDEVQQTSTPRLSDSVTRAPSAGQFEVELNLPRLDRPDDVLAYAEVSNEAATDGISIGGSDIRDVLAPPRFKIAPPHKFEAEADEQEISPADAFASIIHPPILRLSSEVLSAISDRLVHRNKTYVQPAPPEPTVEEMLPSSSNGDVPLVGTTQWLAQIPNAGTETTDSGEFIAITNRVLFDSVAMLSPTHGNGGATSRAKFDAPGRDPAISDDELAAVRIDSAPDDADLGGGGLGGGGGSSLGLTAYAFAEPVARIVSAGVTNDQEFRRPARSTIYGALQAPAIAGDGSVAAIRGGVGTSTISRSSFNSPSLARSGAVSSTASPLTASIARSTAVKKWYFLPAGVKTYGVFDLGPSWNGWVTSQALGVNGGRSGGFISDPTGTIAHAAIWDSSASKMGDVHPTTGYVTSKILAINGPQYVGVAAAKLAGTPDHAIVWTAGSGTNAIDLNPVGAKSSYALASNGLQQIGYAFTNTATSGLQPHAMLWNSSASNFIDLNPVGDMFSYALGGEGMSQVGFGLNFLGGHPNLHALLWTGTPVAVDLHPTIGTFDDSRAVTLSGGQAAGYGTDSATGYNHAILWAALNGAGAIDLNPAGFYDSQVTASNATSQVGLGRVYGDPSGVTHALLWTGSAGRFTDLNAFLPSNFTSAEADGIDATGNIVGWAKDSITGYYHAVEWQPQIPEPTSMVPLAALTTLLVRRRRRTRGANSKPEIRNRFQSRSVVNARA